MEMICLVIKFYCFTLRKNHTIFFLVDLKVYSFNLILNMDFLMALSEFFAKAMPATKSTTKQIDVKQEKPLVNTRSSTIAGGEARTTNMTVHIKIEQPDIILVENMNSVDTKAMILNVSFQLLF